MKTITFYLDFVSPYAFLAFQALPEALQGCSYQVRYRPIVLGALFKEMGVASPASIPAKHGWIRRHTEWLATAHGEAGFAWPGEHPFSSLPLLRLAIACSRAGDINRFTAEAIFRHVWCSAGADALAEDRLATLTDALRLQHNEDLALGSDANKTQLRANTDAALAAGVFGVPSYGVDGQVLWGLDALPMLRDRLAGPSAADAARPGE